MKVYTVQSAGNVPAGTKLWLTGAQASARSHLLTPDDPKGLAKDRKAHETAKDALARAERDNDTAAIERATKARDAAAEKLAERRLYITDDQTAFKAGEEIGIDGQVDRGLEVMLGIEPSAKGKAAEKAAEEKAAEKAAAEKAAEEKAAEKAAAEKAAKK